MPDKNIFVFAKCIRLTEGISVCDVAESGCKVPQPPTTIPLLPSLSPRLHPAIQPHTPFLTRVRLPYKNTVKIH